ncbi:MAG TPA: helix-turn-helix domain-containing protein [Candidatus Dormibacteraeota bacterium]|nr:helix-turn-helix domain-containing protein [Candidatus Dormibacteraeota bacterium]
MNTASGRPVRGRGRAHGAGAHAERRTLAPRREPRRPAATAEPQLPKRERNALRNRTAILAAAREVFNELGYGAATIRDIIRRTHLAAGTFYNYFPDKESVLREIIEEFTHRMRARVHDTRMQARTIEELLRSSYRTCFQLYAEDKELVEMLARNAGELSLLTSASMLEPAVEELVADLRAKEHEGVLPHLDNERLARAAVALGAELGLHMLGRNPVDVEGTAEFATQLMLGGIERLAGSARARRRT